MIVKIVAVKPEQIGDYWPLVIPFLQPALDQDFFHDEESLKGLCAGDKAVLFVAVVDNMIKGAAIAQIESGKFDIVNILSLGGVKFKDWKQQMNDTLTQYAYYMECRYIVANGVKAWQRLWPDFTPGKICYTKEIFA